MEHAGTGGTKRKLKENAFTAKAESGTLKVKILRRDQKPGESLGVASSSASSKTRPGRAPKQPPPPPDSPPKPRPNRKHVPIFYEPQFRQPIKRAGSQSHSSSTDESVAHSTSSTDVPGIHSTSSTDVADASSATSTSSSFVAQLSDVRLQSESTSGGGIGLPPRTNPLFARNDSDGLGTFGELLRPYFPSPSGLQPSFPLGGAQPRTTSSAGLLADQPGLSSALHQLASSSASYRSALDALSTRKSSTSAADISLTDTAATTTSLTTSDTNHTGASGGLEAYRFDPFSALQTAIDHARRSSSTNASADGNNNQNNDKHREIGSPNSNARFYRLEPSGSSAATDNKGNCSAGSMGSPPELSPAFTSQNSLMGGGIHSFISTKSSVEADSSNKAKGYVSSDGSGGKNATCMVEPPPEDPPSFLLQNSRVGGGISMSNLPKAHPSLDRLGSLTRLISQAKEATKDLGSPPKAHLSLDRLVSLTSVASDDGEISKAGMKSTASAPDTMCSSASSDATGGAQSKNVMDLGPPPGGPPAFTIGNSLMGGGIDLQPAATNVNTQNFDWKLHRSASSSGGDVTSNPGGISHGLRARLERKLASSDKSEQLRHDK